MIEEEPPRWLIQPEPTPDELVALLAALRTVPSTGRVNTDDLQSQWTKIARHEQMRVPLDELKRGWSK